MLLWRDVTAVKWRRREGGHDSGLHNYLIPNKLPTENFHGKSHESDREYRRCLKNVGSKPPRASSHAPLVNAFFVGGGAGRSHCDPLLAVASSFSMYASPQNKRKSLNQEVSTWDIYRVLYRNFWMND